ncbi:hypothetical protein BJN34_16370 [Cupriavidus necator]|uniref:Uncharacterized protein n=2 Tax=Cupriavidus TaxID=106589 RepID=A0A1U9UTF1_CUPNE|nr:hypothetical protein BJN34_16370 [Cupriavidus necator]RDK12279.1 hypothetical protein DN412_01675 [Cupriavidus lacunae]
MRLDTAGEADDSTVNPLDGSPFDAAGARLVRAVSSRKAGRRCLAGALLMPAAGSGMGMPGPA